MKRMAMEDQLFTKIMEQVATSNGRLEWKRVTGTYHAKKDKPRMSCQETFGARGIDFISTTT
jgi:hypothetical protein